MLARAGSIRSLLYGGRSIRSGGLRRLRRRGWFRVAPFLFLEGADSRPGFFDAGNHVVFPAGLRCGIVVNFEIVRLFLGFRLHIVEVFELPNLHSDLLD